MRVIGHQVESYSISRHKRPAENFKAILAANEGFQDKDIQAETTSLLIQLKRFQIALKQNLPAFTDLFLLLLSFSFVLYLLYRMPLLTEIQIDSKPLPVSELKEAQEPIVDELLDLTGISSNQERIDPSQINVTELRRVIDDENLERHVRLIEEAQRYQLQFSSRVLFNDSAYVLARSGESILTSLLPNLQEHSGSISIEVHTDGQEYLYGGITSEKVLSQHRAESLRQYFVSKGFAKQAIKLVAFGDSEPLANSENLKDKEQNSRVVFVFE